MHGKNHLLTNLQIREVSGGEGQSVWQLLVAYVLELTQLYALTHIYCVFSRVHWLPLQRQVLSRVPVRLDDQWTVLEQKNKLKGWATIRPKRQFVPSDSSSQATIRPKFQKATIRPIFKKRQFVPNCLSEKLINNL